MIIKTLYPKTECHVPKWFVVDAKGKTLGRLATEISKLLRGKEISYYTPGVDQGNYVIVLNASQVEVSGKKSLQKLYYRNPHTPGNLKIETFEHLQKRIPTRIVEEAVWGMLPKGPLGREQYKRLYVYSNEKMLLTTKLSGQPINEKEILESPNWIKTSL